MLVGSRSFLKIVSCISGISLLQNVGGLRGPPAGIIFFSSFAIFKIINDFYPFLIDIVHLI